MSNFQSEISSLVQDFVSQLTEAWKRAVSEALGVGGGAGAVATTGGRGGRRGGGGGGSSAAAASAAALAARRKGEKRTADELDHLAEQFVEFVKQNPGLRIEQINKQLGTSTKDLQLPIRKLLADGVVKSKGEKRSTQYFPGEGQRQRSGRKNKKG